MNFSVHNGLGDKVYGPGFIDTLDWERFANPPYSPDLVPKDFHLFSSLKKEMRGMYFGTNREPMFAK